MNESSDGVYCLAKVINQIMKIVLSVYKIVLADTYLYEGSCWLCVLYSLLIHILLTIKGRIIMNSTDKAYRLYQNGIM